MTSRISSTAFDNTSGTPDPEPSGDFSDGPPPLQPQVKDLAERSSAAVDERFERNFDLTDVRMSFWVVRTGILALLPGRRGSRPTALAQSVDDLAARAESQVRFDAPWPFTPAQRFEPPDEHAGGDILGGDPAR